MGKQHYETTGFHVLAAKHNHTTPDEEFKYSQWKDKYKEQYVLSHGYHYLEIPYYVFNKNEEYKTMIQNKIKEICELESVTTAG